MMNNDDAIKSFIAKKIAILQNGSPGSKANLAKLRRGVGKDITESVDAWEFIYSDMPDVISNKGDRVSEAEYAVYMALTFYAMHQQGLEKSVHVKGVGLGQAVANIMSADKSNEDAVTRRFNSLITSDDISELSTHLRGMIQLVKSSDRTIGLDYEILASELYYFQFPEGKINVKLSWGKQFYRHCEKKKELKESE